jgi:hypothetical protein
VGRWVHHGVVIPRRRHLAPHGVVVRRILVLLWRHAWSHGGRGVVPVGHVAGWHARVRLMRSRMSGVRAGMRLRWGADERAGAALEVGVHSSTTLRRLSAVMLVVRGVSHLRLLVRVEVAVVATSTTSSLLEATASRRTSLVARIAHHRLGGLIPRVGVGASCVIGSRWSSSVSFASAIEAAEVDGVALLCVGRRTATAR